MIAFDDLVFQQARTVASRESLRALGLFSAPTGSDAFGENELDTWLLVVLRSLINCVAGDEDSALFALDHMRRHRKATKRAPDKEAIVDLKPIASVAEEVLLGICAPGFSVNTDQDDSVVALADGISSVLPGSIGWKSLRYSNNELIQFVPPADLDFRIPLWANDDATAEEPDQWILSNQPQTAPLLSYWSYDEKIWAFWQTWYRGFVDGSPVDVALQRRIAQIHDTIWKTGPKRLQTKSNAFRLSSGSRAH